MERTADPLPLNRAGKVADAVPEHWVDRRLPERAKPFARLARLDRPIGWWLLLWPCWWGVALAAAALERAPSPWHLILFFVGAVVMRGAGCTYNDILDRRIDAQVARTRSRPIPSGAVSVEAATLFMLSLAFVGLAVVLQFNRLTIVTAFGSLAIVALYPLAKRVTDWPQVVLGFAFSWGAVLGWTAEVGAFALAPFVLYAGCIAWTVGYDTIYAHQDQRDDAIIGVRSTARHFGAHSRMGIALAYALTIAAFLAALVLIEAGPLAFAGVAAFAVHLGIQVWRVDPDDPKNCLAAFRSNRWAGWLTFAGLIADAML